MTIYHDSRNPFYRQPQGAVACGTKLKLCVHAHHVKKVWLRLWWNNAESRVQMRRTHEDQFECHLSAPCSPGLLWYYFVAEDHDGGTWYLGNAADGIFKEDHPVIAAELERVTGDQQHRSADQPNGQSLGNGRPEKDHQDRNKQSEFQLKIAEREEKQDQHEAQADPPVAGQITEPGGHASGQIEGILFHRMKILE